MTSDPPTSAAYSRIRQAFWDSVSGKRDRLPASASYQASLIRLYRHLVRPGLRVLELGCGEGDLLAGLEPAFGVGIEFSGAMAREARRRHPQLAIIQADAHALPCTGEFDVVILSDLVNDLWDVQAVLHQLATRCRPSTRIILNFHSRLWQTPLSLARRFGLARPLLTQNWLTREDTANLLYLEGYEVIRQWDEILCPLRLPLVAPLLNRWLARLWPLRVANWVNVVLARPAPRGLTRQRTPVGGAAPVVSVIVPARNEAGNIEELFRRTPEMGSGTELIFVEGHSTDDTVAAIEQAMARHPERRCRLLRQSGKGKGDAVRLGFAHAAGEVLMILDADLTVPPEDLPRFYEALVSDRGEFVNGVRLVYPMEDQAMQFCNLVANKFFGLAFSWVLGQSVKDTLCGTKVLWKTDYERIAANRADFGEFDPFGDFDLLFGAARLNLKITDLPVRYRKRTYGTTNIQRWRHGVLLLRMLFFAARRLKFV